MQNVLACRSRLGASLPYAAHTFYPAPRHHSTHCPQGASDLWKYPLPRRSPLPLRSVDSAGSSHLPQRQSCETSNCVIKTLLHSWTGTYVALAFGLSFALTCAFPNAAGATATQSTFSLTAAIKGFLDFVLHLDVHLSSIIAKHGTLTYGLLFGIVFCETGLVLTPFLPGDSLLFVAGALAGLGKLNISVVSSVFIAAAILGDAVNYGVGSWLGQKALNAKLVSESNIAKTERFFRNYGGKTIVLARFVPIVRTFAPFVAGMSHMDYQKFAAFNVGGAILWTFLFTGTGYFFGNLPFVEHNFSLVVLAIVAISVLPIVYELWAARSDSSETPRTNPQT